MVEKAQSVAVVPYSGSGKTLARGTLSLTNFDSHAYGNVHAETTNGINISSMNWRYLLSVIGTKDLVIAASPDGILSFLSAN